MGMAGGAAGWDFAAVGGVEGSGGFVCGTAGGCKLATGAVKFAGGPGLRAEPS